MEKTKISLGNFFYDALQTVAALLIIAFAAFGMKAYRIIEALPEKDRATDLKIFNLQDDLRVERSARILKDEDLMDIINANHEEYYYNFGKSKIKYRPLDKE